MMEPDVIKEHYKKLAKDFGSSKEMSMEDTFTKDAEIQDIIRCLCYFRTPQFRNNKVLEIGCGNGFTAQSISESVNFISYTGIDFCEELIKSASERNIPDYNFKVGNVLNLDFPDNSFDIVISERCLINLDSWEKQQQALSEIFRVLEKGGIYIMIECFTDGLDNINEARKVVGLDPITQKFFNKYLDKKDFTKYIKNKFFVYDEYDEKFAKIHKSNFLSTYYFGRSVLYPAVTLNKILKYNNKFVEFFSYMEPYGNYSYIQSIVLARIR